MYTLLELATVFNSNVSYSRLVPIIYKYIYRGRETERERQTERDRERERERKIHVHMYECVSI